MSSSSLFNGYWMSQLVCWLFEKKHQEEKGCHFVPVQVISKEGIEEDAAKSLTFSTGLSVKSTFKRDELWKCR